MPPTVRYSRLLRQPCSHRQHGRQSFPIWNLLANNHGRRERPSPALPSLPVLLKTTSPTSSGPANHTSLLAIHHLESRCHQTFQGRPGGFKYILVAINKFTKWFKYNVCIESSSKAVMQFMAEITHRFGITNCVITDLRSQFTALEFWDFCKDNLISVFYSSVAHPCATDR